MKESVHLCLATALGCFAIVAARDGHAGQLDPSLERTKHVSQHGVTWKFDREVPVGKFVNGDYYVVGPVTVVEIDPASVAGEVKQPRRGRERLVRYHGRWENHCCIRLVRRVADRDGFSSNPRNGMLHQ